MKDLGCALMLGLGLLATSACDHGRLFGSQKSGAPGPDAPPVNDQGLLSPAAEAPLTPAQSQCLQAFSAPVAAAPAAADPAPGKASLSIAKLKEMLATSSYTTLNELLSALAVEHPDVLKKQRVLLYKSASLFKDEIDPMHPRALLFDGSLLIGLAGDSGQASSEKMELIELDAATQSFKFALLDFAKLATTTDRSAIVDEAPTSCAECHHGRPIWATYNLWPGSYGGNDDGFDALDGMSGALPEAATLDAFCSKQMAGQSRYRLYFDKLGKSTDCRTQLKDGGVNSAFTDAVVKLNNQQIASTVRRSPGYYQLYKYALYGALTGCSDIPALLPRPIRAQHQLLAGSLGHLAVTGMDAAKAEFGLRKQAYGLANQLPDASLAQLELEDMQPLLAEVPYVAALRYLLEGQPLGGKDLAMTYWSTSAPPGQSSYSFATKGSFQTTLRAALVQDDAALAGFAAMSTTEVCAKLKTLSLSALGDAAQACLQPAP